MNMALSADGKIASANRAITSLGSRRDHDHLLHLRTTVDAIMTGAGTVNAQPNITLGVNHRATRPPLRILVTGHGRANLRARLFRESGAPLIILATRQLPLTRRAALTKRAHTLRCFGHSTLDFPAALAWLRQKWNVRRLLCEGGGRLNAGLLAAGLVDEIHLTHCPLILGGSDAPTMADGTLARHLGEAIQLRLSSLRVETGEAFATYKILLEK
ncbi:MAG: dihydrofolate reductase family protein [Verrucomicrobiota bacterium]|nr:dihydrofolate reductase family protein [Verrucomicrobiota bacterium]